MCFVVRLGGVSGFRLYYYQSKIVAPDAVCAETTRRTRDVFTPGPVFHGRREVEFPTKQEHPQPREVCRGRAGVWL
jgi:hypothetical protein